MCFVFLFTAEKGKREDANDSQGLTKNAKTFRNNRAVRRRRLTGENKKKSDGGRRQTKESPNRHFPNNIHKRGKDAPKLARERKRRFCL